MRTLKHIIPYTRRSEVFTLYYLTDLHVGAKACDEKLLKRDVETIQNNPNARWIGGGDYIDAICHIGDKRFKPSTIASFLHGEDDIMGAQVVRVVDILAPIADKCLGLVSGNHEAAALKFYGYHVYWSVVSGIARAAGVAPDALALGVQGFVQISFRRGQPDNPKPSTTVINVYVHHGYGGGILPGGHALTLGRVLSDTDCDLALLGHRHTRIVLDKTIVRPGGLTALHSLRIAAFVPSYLRAYIEPSTEKCPIDTYAEEKRMPPQHIGTFPILIKPDVKAFQVVLNSSAEVAPEAFYPEPA